MDFEVTDSRRGTAYVSEEIHFTGGLRGAPTNLGWALYPVSDDVDSDAIVFTSPRAHLEFATRECGVQYLGACMKYVSAAGSPPMEIWEFGARDPQNGLGGADSWACIGHQAAMAGDARYSETASYVGASLRAAGLRLRDVSNGYHDQLNWALKEKRTPGGWFSNAALQDLYADFHSLASELSSTRDHVATIAAKDLGAPDRIDSMSRLEDWIDKPSNRGLAAAPIAHTLLDALGPKTSPGWLRRLGEIRNEMLHRIPMSANRSFAGLALERSETSLGDVSRIRLAEPQAKMPLSQQQLDPLAVLGQYGANLEQLCRTISKHAKYPAHPLEFVG